MPGLVGLITRMPRACAEERLRRMVAAIHHESFDAVGTWTDESLGVYVGWTAHNDSFSDGMPLANEQGDVCLVFSGEEYPEAGTVQRLKERGHSLGAQASSYLVHLYEEDASFPAGLSGIFHGLVSDRRRGAVTLFNDRYGMHPIHYHECKEALYFAAEAKAILAVLPALRVGDPRGLGELVSFGCVLQNRTIFEGIRVLPGGSAWTFEGGSVQKKRYFEPSKWEEQEPLEPESYYHQLREVWFRNLARYFSGHERVGMTLTGGLDTRVIMAWHKPGPGSLPCYTFGGMFRDCEDVRLARRVADICRQSHEVITVGDDFLSNFPRYAERSVHLTEGSVDVSRCSDLYVSEKAREFAPVKVVGTYGSEIIRHAVMFKPTTPKPGLYRPELLSYVDQARATYAEVRQTHPVTFAAFRQSPWYHHGVLGLEQSQLTVRSPYLDNDFVRTVFRAPKIHAPDDDVRLRLVRDGNPELARIRTDRGIGGRTKGLLSAASRCWLEFTMKAEYAYDYGMPQWIARVDGALSSFHVERLFLGRQRLLHYRVWYRDQLSDYVQQVLLDPVTLGRPYLEPKEVEAVVRGHVKGHRNYTTEIHKLLTLELLHRLFLDPR